MHLKCIHETSVMSRKASLQTTSSLDEDSSRREILEREEKDEKSVLQENQLLRNDTNMNI